MPILVGALTLAGNPAAVVYPFVLGGISVLGAICGVVFVNVANGKPANILMGAVVASAIVSAILFWPTTHYLFPNGVNIAGEMRTPTQLYWASLVGLVMTAVVVVITNYYTSMHHAPVQKIARASETGHATNIIAGLAVGQHATALPVGFIGIAILVSFHFGGLYGIAIAVMSMLSMAGIVISLDSFGPITDNAGGIAVMSNLPKEVRGVTDELDAVGNTMKAVTKGYAIASAGLAALVLFGSVRRGTQNARHPKRRAVRIPIFAHGSESYYRAFYRRTFAIHLHCVQHGCGRQSRGRSCARSTASVASETGNLDGPRHARLRHVRGHCDQGSAAGDDRARAFAGGFCRGSRND